MRRLALALVAGCAAVALTAAPASAHASLVSTEPAENATLPAGQPPAAITLHFTEGVQVPHRAVELLDGTGGEVEGVGDAAHGASSSIVTAALPAVDDGTYVVNWRVVSTDGHPISGAFTFTVGAPSADAQTVAGLLERDTNRGVGISFGLVRTLAFAAVLVLVGALVFVRFVWPSAGADRAVRSTIWLAWTIALVTVPLGMGLQAAYTARSELSAAWDPDVLRDVFDSDFGKGWVARGVLLLLAVPAIARLLPRSGHAPDGVGAHGSARNVLVGVAGLIAVALLATIAVAGHARTGRATTLAFVTDVVHLGAAAVWLGGAVVLGLAMFRSIRPRGATAAASRFSRIAAPAMAVIVVSGAVQAWRQVGELGSLLDTTYGRLLLAKLGLVILIVAAASASRDIVRKRIAPRLLPAGPGAARADIDPDDVRDLRNAVTVELGFAAVVLAVTSVLVVTQPARVADAERAAPVRPAGYAEVLRGEELAFDVRVSPGLAGVNEVQIATTTLAGAPFEPIEISASMAAPGVGIEPVDLALEPTGPGSYRATVSLVPGTWDLEIRALRSEIEQEVGTGTVTVG